MAQSVSPWTTVWEAGNCPSSAATGAMSGPTRVVSWAAATEAARVAAAKTSRGNRLEWKIVVSLIQRLREPFERLGFPGSGRPVGRRPGAGLGSRRLGAPVAPTLGRQQEQLARDHLGGVPSLLLPILPRAVLDPPLDIDAVSLLQKPLRHVGQLGTLVVPAHHPVPLGLLLLLAVLRRPLPPGGNRERRYLGPVVRGSDVGISPQIPNEHGFVQAAAHRRPPNVRRGGQGRTTLYDPQVILSIKDTPLGLEFCIAPLCRNGSPQDHGVFTGASVIPHSSAHLSKAQSPVQVARAPV